MSDPVFFVPARSLTAAEAAVLVGAELHEDRHGDVRIAGLASAAEGGAGKLVYVEGKKNRALLRNVDAAALLCSADMAADAPGGIAVLVTPRPQHAFARIGRTLFPEAAIPGAMTGETGVSASAHVDASACLEPGVVIEPGAVIGADVRIGAGTVIAPHAVIGRSCRIGRGGFIGAGAVVQYALIGDRVVIQTGARIGQDGFGFTGGAGGPERIPQVGRVIVQNDVEVGANATIDRGALGDTVIGENSKIDNLVQIAHNCRIGRNCIIAGLVGLSGSVTVGDNAMIGGGVGAADHLTIGEGARLAGGSGLMHDVPAGEVWAGFPARPIGTAMREQAMIARLSKANAWKGLRDG